MRFSDMDNEELLDYALQQSRISKERDENSRDAYAELKRRRQEGMPAKYVYVDDKAADGQPITDGDMRTLDFAVNWSIYKDRDENDCDNWECDFDAPEGVSDDIYEVEGYGWGKETHDITSGIEIKNGRFVPTKTMKAIQNLQRILDDRHHIYIERLKWDGERFQVEMGS